MPKGLPMVTANSGGVDLPQDAGSSNAASAAGTRFHQSTPTGDWLGHHSRDSRNTCDSSSICATTGATGLGVAQLLGQLLIDIQLGLDHHSLQAMEFAWAWSSIAREGRAAGCATRRVA
jgi:hypothetical protein